jgi:3'-phosphoadenosine 5'-phosphosulfate sulfotransferase (PAPS reductase)/FAD synthetase
MNDSQREFFLLRSRHPAYHRKVAETQAIIDEMMTRAKRPYLAFSAGKDSHVLLHWLQAMQAPVEFVWSNDEWNLPETIELVDSMPFLHRIAANVRHASFFMSWDYPDASEHLPPGTHWIDNDHGLQTYARRRGYDGVFIGLRANENSRRRLHLRTHGVLFWSQQDQNWQCNPLAWWTALDVWAYLISNQVRYNRAYDRLFEMNIPIEEQRIGPLAVERALGYGQLAILRRGWPDLYQRFVARYPEAAGYT